MLDPRGAPEGEQRSPPPRSGSLLRRCASASGRSAWRRPGRGICGAGHDRWLFSRRRAGGRAGRSTFPRDEHERAGRAMRHGDDHVVDIVREGSAGRRPRALHTQDDVVMERARDRVPDQTRLADARRTFAPARGDRAYREPTARGARGLSGQAGGEVSTMYADGGQADSVGTQTGQATEADAARAGGLRDRGVKTVIPFPTRRCWPETSGARRDCTGNSGGPQWLSPSPTAQG